MEYISKFLFILLTESFSRAFDIMYSSFNAHCRSIYKFNNFSFPVFVFGTLKKCRCKTKTHIVMQCKNAEFFIDSHTSKTKNRVCCHFFLVWNDASIQFLVPMQWRLKFPCFQVVFATSKIHCLWFDKFPFLSDVYFCHTKKKWILYLI